MRTVSDYLPLLGEKKVEIEFSVLQAVGAPEKRVLWHGPADKVPDGYRMRPAVLRYSHKYGCVIIDLGFL